MLVLFLIMVMWIASKAELLYTKMKKIDLFNICCKTYPVSTYKNHMWHQTVIKKYANFEK